MAKRYFLVTYEAGAFLNNYFYAKDSVVALDIKPGQAIPLWAQECDRNGNPLGTDYEDDEIVHNVSAVDKKMGDALGNKLAAQAGEPSPVLVGNKPNIVENTDETRASQIQETLKLLDAKDDAHWTKDGKPNLNVLKETLGFQVSRQEVDAIAPDFLRPVEA